MFGAARLYLGRWALTAAFAFLLWSPWLWELQQYGGYAAVAKNHSGYFTGLGQWWANGLRQSSAQWLYLGYLFWLGSIVAVVGAVCWATWCYPLGTSTRPTRTAAMLRRAPALLSAWMMSAWMIGLGVAVPMYAPYPRLALPLVIAACTILGLFGKAATSDVLIDDVAAAPPPLLAMQRRELWWFLPLASIVGVAFLNGLSQGRAMPQWESRTAFLEISNRVVARLESERVAVSSDVRCILYVVAEPGLFFHLGAAQRNSPISHVAIPAADFGAAKSGSNTSGLPVYLVAGPHADQSEADRLIAEGRLEAVAEFEYRPSNLVLLDSRPAWDLPPKDKPVIEHIRLLHVKP